MPLTVFQQKHSDASVSMKALLMSLMLTTESWATEVRSCPWRLHNHCEMLLQPIASIYDLRSYIEAIDLPTIWTHFHSCLHCSHLHSHTCRCHHFGNLHSDTFDCRLKQEQHTVQGYRVYGATQNVL